MFVPSANAPELALIGYPLTHCVGSLVAVVAHLLHGAVLPGCEPRAPNLQENSSHILQELALVRGQACAKRALEIAAAGGHNLLMIGPPGSGKTLLARSLPGLLPDLAENEALEVATIASVVTITGYKTAWQQRPFRTR